MFCKNCGKEIPDGTKFCPNCGGEVSGSSNVSTQQSAQPVVQPNVYAGDVIDQNWPVKSKTAAGVLAILLGGIGVHKFYLGKIGMGIIYILFCWTGVPAVIGLIEGIGYLTSSDEKFQTKNHVRIEK